MHRVEHSGGALGTKMAAITSDCAPPHSPPTATPDFPFCNALKLPQGSKGAARTRPPHKHGLPNVDYPSTTTVLITSDRGEMRSTSTKWP